MPPWKVVKIVLKIFMAKYINAASALSAPTLSTSGPQHTGARTRLHTRLHTGVQARLVSLLTGSLLALGFVALLATPLGVWLKLFLAITGGTLAGVMHAKAQLYIQAKAALGPSNRGKRFTPQAAPKFAPFQQGQ
jgi:hypothetical protein